MDYKLSQQYILTEFEYFSEVQMSHSRVTGSDCHIKTYKNLRLKRASTIGSQDIIVMFSIIIEYVQQIQTGKIGECVHSHARNLISIQQSVEKYRSTGNR